jgi:hypothetical protein
MKSIKSITDLDDSDFIIKWRITEMCNANCSYCIRKNKHVDVIPEKLDFQQKRLCEVAEQISRFLNGTDFNKVKIDLIGGEVSIFDLKEICSHLTTDKIWRINLTTNLLKPASYYSELCDYLHSRGTKCTAVASFHYEFQTIDKYFEKITVLKDKLDILGCELVSNKDNQELCKEFIKRCEELHVDYMVEGDLRFDEMETRKNGLIIASSKKVKHDRYKVCFTDGTEKKYTSRNQLLMDANNKENMWQKAIHTKGFICTCSHNFVYIDFDTAVGRKGDSCKCTIRMPIEEFNITEPRECTAENCTLCGHQSIWRKD